MTGGIIRPATTFVALLLSLIAGPSSMFAAAPDPIPGVDGKWSHYVTPNFEMFSRNPDRDSRELLHNLELVHALFMENFRFSPRRPVPMTVYFFARDKFFRAYQEEELRKLDDLAASYQSDADRGILLLAPLPTYEAAQQLAYSMYVYHLFRVAEEEAPLWYMTGMAGVFRNLQVTPFHISVGQVSDYQVNYLRTAKLLPIEVLLAVDQKSEIYRSNVSFETFQAQSWLLMHYLYFGRNDLPRAKVDEFVKQSVNNWNDYNAAENERMFTEVLGLDYKGMNNVLKEYVRGGKFSWGKTDPPKIPDRKTYSRRQVPIGEMRERLAELALRMTDSGAGKLVLLDAVGKKPNDARLHETLGAIDLREGNRERALERWNRAIEAGTTNPVIHHEVGMIEASRWFSRFDVDFRLPEETAARLRTLLAKSIETAPNQSAAYEMLAWVEATSERPEIGNVNLVQRKFKSNRPQDRTILALALVRWRVGNAAGSVDLLNQLDRLGPDRWVADASERLRAAIENRPPRVLEASAEGRPGSVILMPPPVPKNFPVKPPVK